MDFAPFVVERKLITLSKFTLIMLVELCLSLLNFSFRTEKNLEAHMAVHLSSNKSFTCKVCGRSYNTLSNLRTHSITHSNERPYHCHLCKKCFKRKQDLKVF